MSLSDFSITQDIFVGYVGQQIHVTCLREDDLGLTVPAFLESAQGHVVGLAPVYGSKCRLTHVAISSVTEVLVVVLPSAAKGKAKKKGKKTCSVSNLQKFLKNPTVVKCAFQMDKLASSMFLDYKCRIRNGKDLLSLETSTNSRRSLEALYVALSGGNDRLINKQATSSLFLNEETLNKPEVVALQAWTACFAACLPGRLKTLNKAPSINTGKSDALLLKMVAKNIRDMNLLISLKPNRIKHDLELQSIQGGELRAVSQRFKTKVSRLDGTRMVVVTAQKGRSTITRIVHSVDVKGRSAKLPVGGGLRVQDIRLVETVGRDPLSDLEESRSSMMLLALQNRVSLYSDPFFRKIWLTLGKPNWSATPRTFPAPPVYFPSQRLLNPSQMKAIECILSDSDADRVVLIQGPPGTGKTTVIAAAVTSTILASNNDATVWLISHSNVAVKNIAEKLATVDFFDFKIVVSKTYHFEWHEHQYAKIAKNVITSDHLPYDTILASRMLGGSRVILCTLAMLSSARLADIIGCVPLQTVVFDEASQIEVGDYFPMLVSFRPTLRKLVFIGDDKQLAPYGTSDIPELESIFEKHRLRKQAIMLDTQYRMPIPVGNFISQNVYQGLLKSRHAQLDPLCCRFVNVKTGVETQKGHSWTNPREVEIVIRIVRQLVKAGKSFRIITPYDPQRNLLESGLKSAKLPWEDKCFNVDAFQGNEDDYIVVSVVRTKKLGFLNDMRRMNVMLTRCKKGMMICTSRAFIEGVASETLVGKLCQHLGDSSWIEEGKIIRD